MTFMMTKQICQVAIILLFIGLHFSPMVLAADEGREVVVGVWDNPPIVFKDEKGNPVFEPLNA